MSRFSLGACLLLFSIYIETSCCEPGQPKVSHVVRSKRSLTRQPSEETFNMFIKEQGSRFTEKVIFDMANKTVIHHVPAHRDLAKADFMVDFDSNVTVTRLPENGFCYLTPRSPDEPSMDLLRKSMSMVSSGKYKIRESVKVSNVWTPTGLADRSKLTKNVNEFCHGLPIHLMKKVEQDGITVGKGVIRTKRSGPFPFPTCKPWEQYNLAACASPNQDYNMRCKSTSVEDCVHWITCPGGLPELIRRDGLCGTKHVYNRAMCCDMSCPTQ